MKKYENLIDELENHGFDMIEYDNTFDILIIDTFFSMYENDECEEIISDLAWMYNVEKHEHMFYITF